MNENKKKGDWIFCLCVQIPLAILTLHGITIGKLAKQAQKAEIPVYKELSPGQYDLHDISTLGNISTIQINRKEEHNE